MDMNYREADVGGRGWAGWSGVKGGKWDSCNRIINKYIKNTLDGIISRLDESEDIIN